MSASSGLISKAVDRPIAVVAFVFMVILFGMVALQTIPIQLAPDVNRPVITITTHWPGAAPVEVEREIMNIQEQELSGLENLNTITGNAQQGRSRITLEFDVGTNMDKAMLLVSNRLDRVSNYPEEADSPQLSTSGSEDNAIAWFRVVRTPGNSRPVHEYGTFVENFIKERIERVSGVGEVNVFGGSDPEIQIVVDPVELARFELTAQEVISALRRANVSSSVGDVDEGKRRYVVRSEGGLNSLESIRQIVVRSDASVQNGGAGRIRIEDIASVELGYKRPGAIIRASAEPAIPFNVTREVGANVIETMAGIRKVVDDLNATVMPGSGLELDQVYDETVYINSAIELVQQNIWVGGILAAFVILLFLRSFAATLIVSIAIPVSIVGAFVAMSFLGRSINVISLAGLAFAVGMVVDAAIVILENIYRMRESGKPARQAAVEGAQEVWGAVLVSVLTTILVFVPVLVSQLEIGQLFRDIAVAISVAVVLSLIASITVIPALSKRFLAGGASGQYSIVRLRIPVIDHAADALFRLIIWFTRKLIERRFLAFAWVSMITAGAVMFAIRFLPSLEYLPEGNNNLIFGLIVPPPGYNLETMTGIANNIESAIRPYWVGADNESSPADLNAPRIDRFFFVSTRSNMFVGAIAEDPSRISELLPIMQGPVFREPGTFGFMSQPSIFGRGIGSGRKIDLDVSGNTLDEILFVAGQAAGKVFATFPRSEGHQFRPNPGLELGVPEVRIIPDRVRLADNNLTASDLSIALDVFNDGLRVDETIYRGEATDITLLGPRDANQETQNIQNIPIVTPDGEIIPVKTVAAIDMTAGPTAIRHRERLRTITLEIRPAPGVTIEEAVNLISREIVEPLKEEGLPDGVTLRISGTADALQKTWDSMVVQLLIALVIVYLVLAILFESFIYPLIILLSVPVAAAGGIAGLAVLNLYVHQPLDMLTMLGFVILIGIVVNNAILLVHQSINNLRRDNVSPREAILTATRNRIRPIFMSTLTSVFGMLPLVLFPGAGSELYRGLGSVVVGGLSMSALLTLFMVPPLAAIVVVSVENRRNRKRRKSIDMNQTVIDES